MDELARMPQVEKAYALWCELREEVLRTHRDALPERLSLSRQKEFKQIKNIVIREAVRLAELSSPFCDENPEDEWEDTPVPEGAQAAQYRKAKEIVYSQAPLEEKKAALSELEQLYDKGFSSAAHLLGKAYRDGTGVQKDQGAAEWWFCKAAMTGSDASEYALCRLLEQQGRFTEAAAWYQKAVEQDNQYAQYRLAKLLDDEEIPKDTEKVLRLLTAAAEQGNQFAQYTLGKLYLLGKEIPQDREAAINSK